MFSPCGSFAHTDSQLQARSDDCKHQIYFRDSASDVCTFIFIFGFLPPAQSLLHFHFSVLTPHLRLHSNEKCLLAMEILWFFLVVLAPLSITPPAYLLHFFLRVCVCYFGLRIEQRKKKKSSGTMKTGESKKKRCAFATVESN